jgi:2-oxoglutarate dehydrogenase E2 component (dihydrolipoamide succinyltransferase)
MGESINSGVLAKWHVHSGDLVVKDQLLYELETDKISSEGLAEANGRITLKVDAGAEVKIGQLVAQIDTSVAVAAAVVAPQGTGTDKASAAQPVKPASPVFSPAVRRLADETGIDPSKLEGSGKAGRVTKGDMLAAAPQKFPSSNTPVFAPTHPGNAPAVQGNITPNARQTRRKLSPLRARIAQRLISAQHDAAMLTTFNEVDMSAIMAMRARYQEDFTKRNGVKLGFMSFFVKAVVNALREVPSVNCMLDGDTVIENHFYDIGVAVSTEKGLLVPVLRDCDRLTFSGIEKELGESAKKAREGKISLTDLDGGVFTITNGGIFGSLLSTPIINPPQCGILGMHAIQERPVVRDGQIVIRPMMYLALSYDHRLVDGKDAVTFLVRVKQAVEDPSRLFLGL